MIDTELFFFQKFVDFQRKEEQLQNNPLLQRDLERKTEV
jgi:hypothetical protein